MSEGEFFGWIMGFIIVITACVFVILGGRSILEHSRKETIVARGKIDADALSRRKHALESAMKGDFFGRNDRPSADELVERAQKIDGFLAGDRVEIITKGGAQ